MNSTQSFNNNPLNKIIGLSIILSMGFLLVILATIYGNWFPIIIGIIFLFAHLPIIITKSIVNSSDYEFNFDPNSNNQTNVVIEVGKFLSSFLIVSGIYLPILLHHSLILNQFAMILTIIGGCLIYGTVYTFSSYFDESEDQDELADLGGGVI
ncbi:uncharacterized protein J8A68_003106 [[Candida] subhashii]|uniref:Vacuolar protein sorting-associated protein 55 n=1 Tax=[Candida] subhashii TaxID=561895 RepID=A0A8J5QJM9_9ASCO|nr:uncharacterized protein J8A68_003106 [[Candida] subhashii]KAG7663358.1 hypothetical protein J8A68_003106 [[Candida] subhashii]